MDDRNPTIVIVNGANWIGSKLVETLTNNKGNVIVIDDFNDSSMPFIKHYSDNKRFVFIEKDKINTIRQNFTKIKYFIHLKNDFNAKDDEVSSKQFIKETKFVDEVLTIALEKNSSYILVSSIHLHKDFVLRKNFTRTNKSAYTESDLQDYIERTVLEYHHKAGLNSRIARLGNIYGPEMDLSKDPLLLQIISDSFYRDEIRVFGDGLEYMYYVFISDAIQGILRALFTSNTEGQVYSLTNPEEISILSIVNKVLSLQPNAKKIKFLKGDPNSNPLYERAYIPDPNLSEIGWNPIMTFERGLVQLYDYFKTYISKYGSYDGKEHYDEAQTPSNSNLQFDFDNTLNLADIFYTYNQAHESEQFREFYKKLNAEDSPIYNNKAKKSTSDMHAYLQPPQKSKVFSSIFTLLWIVVLFAFLVVPVSRLGFVAYSVDSSTSKFTQDLGNPTYEDKFASADFTKDFEDSLISINWLINLSNQNTNKENYELLLASYEESLEIYNIIVDKNLKNKLASSDSIGESDLAEFRNLVPKVQTALSDIEIYKKVNLPNNIKARFNKIQIWLQEVNSQLSAKINLSE